MLFVILLPISGYSQAELDAAEIRFYQDLAINDARQEQEMLSLGQEDEADFWKDQKAFEALLRTEKPTAYRIYINTKSELYRQHQLACGEAFCEHSENFMRQASFYIINGTANSGVVFAQEKKPSVPRK